MLGVFRDRADTIIDTTNLKPLELAARLGTLFSDGSMDAFRLTFESFGYKRGVPFEADMVFDMRFLPNPFYESALRPLSGADAAVRDYIFRILHSHNFWTKHNRCCKCSFPAFAIRENGACLLRLDAREGGIAPYVLPNRWRSGCAASLT